MMGAWLAGHLKNWLAPDTAGKWRSAPLPAGAFASYGGSFYAIPKRAAHKAEAWEFVRFMTADQQTQLDSLRTLDTFPALLSAQQDPVIDEPMPFLGGQKARRAVARHRRQGAGDPRRQVRLDGHRRRARRVPERDHATARTSPPRWPTPSR